MPFRDFRKGAGAGSLDQVLFLFIGDFPNDEASAGCHFDLLFSGCGKRFCYNLLRGLFGNDSNNGTSKTSPWQNAPGMQTCAKLCNSTTINPGDSIILRGGVTWPNASFMWNLPGGATGNPVYVGVDQTWYAGSSWVRPVLAQVGQ